MLLKNPRISLGLVLEIGFVFPAVKSQTSPRIRHNLLINSLLHPNAILVEFGFVCHVGAKVVKSAVLA